jgi:hypothetical protein
LSKIKAQKKGKKTLKKTQHVGIITDRFFPFTTTPCPYLQHRSVINVYLHLHRPERAIDYLTSHN